MKRLLAFLVAVHIVLFAVVASAQKDPPLRLVQAIPMPDVKEGDIAHFAVDLQGNRLFLATGAGKDNNTIEVFDLSANKGIRSIHGVDGAKTMVYLPATKQLWVVCNKGDGNLKIINTNTYAVAETVQITEGANSSVYDAAKHLLYVVSGGGGAKMKFSLIDFVDINSHKQVGDIKIDSTNIEQIAIEKNGPRMFANIRDKSLVGVIDREKKALISTWTLGGVHVNTPMDLDEANRRLFVVSREPARLLVLDTDSGKIVANLPTAEVANDVIFDSGSKRIYVAGDGFVVVYLQQDADHYAELARVPTSLLAKTAFLVPQLKRLYVAAPKHGEKTAEVMVYDVQ